MWDRIPQVGEIWIFFSHIGLMTIEEDYVIPYEPGDKMIVQQVADSGDGVVFLDMQGRHIPWWWSGHESVNRYAEVLPDE